MPRVTPLLVGLAALLAAVPSGTAISCYKCTDALSIDTDGDDSLGGALAGGLNALLKSFGKEVGLPPCTEFRSNEARFRTENCPSSNSCSKLVLPDGKTIRLCSPVTLKDDCQEGNGATTCFCSTDYCNAAGRGAPALPLLLLLLLPAAFLALLNSQL